MQEKNLSEWLKAKCEEEGLSLRQMATKIGVSHQTIVGLLNGKKALPPTIKKLTKAFGGSGINQKLALEDHLLVLAGYRTQRPEGKERSEAFCRLVDKLERFNEPQVKLMEHFADYFIDVLAGD